MPSREPTQAIEAAVRAALAEDAGRGDLTTEAAIPESLRARGAVVAREPGVLAGAACARRAFTALDEAAVFPPSKSDGDAFAAGDVVFRVEAKARALLTGERVALNFLQRLSGVATATRRLVDLAGGRAAVLDTRKTTPGLRALERHAVELGGGRNHRFGLSDQVLLKENHFALAGAPVRETVARVRARVGDGVVVGAEAQSVAEAREAMLGGADYVLLDNQEPSALAAQVAELRAFARTLPRRVELEASGGITADSIEAFSRTGVDRLSVGAITHSVRAVDLALDVEAIR
ncbi:MAG TPA: carboxylating nicotinate-nucleotide diphosphorylase [Planctomycetota bacterium]|nr:carboxylating nicotinate-nucleotide diphosphorylase [Planctomycetota bacterium]